MENTEHSGTGASQGPRLSYLYEVLSTTCHAVPECDDQGELLAVFFRALVAYGGFPVVFLASAGRNAEALQVEWVHGHPREQLPELTALLTLSGQSLPALLQRLGQGRVQVLALPTGSAEPSPWLTRLLDLGVAEQALLPLVAEGRLLALLGLYSRQSACFDEPHRRLLERMMGDLGNLLRSLDGERQRVVAQRQAILSESRFRQVFEASPLPMQISSLATRRLRAINKAHEQLLGYAAGDIATEERWFAVAYPDARFRESLRQHWEESILRALAGEVVRSPEVELRCKDGGSRWLQGTMTISGDDVIVAWIDLTEIRRKDIVLQESELRFRRMIEQTISGIYVWRDGRFIYVNPRFCDIAGWPAESLLGHQLTEFLVPDAQSEQEVRSAWQRLLAGEPHVAFNVPLHRQDGGVVELGMNTKLITWDDDLPAAIVMAQDITERRLAEQRIASYMQQLKESVRATLAAVAHMVELRDPYTAGHERRVGLIARAIAEELGWSQERCELVEMVGLVHDIGKIAVPAEYLTKPTRLSPLEMEIIRGHAEAGYQILKDVPFGAPVAEIIRQHHERLDGSGYPRGLKGEAIFPEARVLAVADLIESMGAHRPYRAAVGIEAALAVLARDRGTLFDPDVVDAVFRLVREKHYQLPA